MVDISKKSEILSSEETREYFELLRKGDKEARNIIIEKNLGLVNLALKKLGDHSYKDVLFSREDLYCNGVIGLIKAVDTFDISKNFAFSTYAVRCISNEILMKLRRKKLTQCSIYDKVSNDSNELIISRLEDTCNVYSKIEETSVLDEALSILTEKESNVLKLLYTKELTTTQIGKQYNVSQSCISRLKIKALEKLKNYYLNDYDEQKVNKLKY